MELRQQRAVSTLRKATLLVQQREDSKLALNEVETFSIVNPVNVGPIDALAIVLELLEGEDVSIEVLLQLLVCVIDVELLEVVRLQQYVVGSCKNNLK